MLRNASRMAAGNQLGQAASLIFNNVGYAPVFLNAVAALKRDYRDSDRGTRQWIDANPLPSNVFADPKEREELLARALYLVREVACEPKQLINKMPEVIGRYYQGQWAIYACSYTIRALANLAQLYPEVLDEFRDPMRKIVEMILHPEMRLYDTMAYKGEEALQSLSGDNSHMTYLSILAWSMGNYRRATGDTRYDERHRYLCDTLVRRMLKAPLMNLPSFPNKVVFMPDMFVTPWALKDYGDIHNHEYDDVVRKWVDTQRRHLTDSATGLLRSRYSQRSGSRRRQPMLGTYSALNVSSLCMIDPEYGRQQYELLKRHFMKWGKYVGIKEHLDKMPSMTFDIDAGPIIEGLSPSGTAFAMGAATVLGDWETRRGLLRTAELAGHTVSRNGMSHYKLADIMLTGEAITLAMRTMIPVALMNNV